MTSRYYPNSFSSSSSASIKGCCCCFVLFFLFLILISLDIILITILAVKPKSPNSISNKPPLNIFRIKYDDSTFNIIYHGVPLRRYIIVGFYQAAYSIKNIQTTMLVDRVNLLQEAATELVTDASTDDRVKLQIMGDVNAKIRVIGITLLSMQVSIFTFYLPSRIGNL
ncbi:unnamed protein product [Lactuca virosa]|uniref:Late embryogenesis abundant protein LEA-2 subgroup domain-containing protein n=1 Tax=Lactuca virosa TaxID=75947 RepID=A0AAU9PJN3_9ASTR|nr:unnamed protein product [Lactuca virosa]